MKKQDKEYLIILTLPLLMLIFAFYYSSIDEIYIGLKKILTANNILITDYFYIAGVSAAFVNASIITIVNLFILYKLELRLNGLLVATIFLMLSYSLMGKTMLNIIPFYIGTVLNSYVYKKKLKGLIVTGMMSTTLAPLVSSLPLYIGIPIAIFIGFIFPFVTKHVVHFHSGYSLYNSGLAGGMIGIIIYSILKALGINFDLNIGFYEKYEYSIFFIFFIYFIFLVIIGYMGSKNTFKLDLYLVYRHTGRLVTDFIQKEGFYISLFNMGTLGLLSLLITYIFKTLNGPVICGMIMVVAFGGFGKHLRNVIPVILGVIIARYIFVVDIPTTVFLLALFLSTTLAPIAGKFGIISGVISGILFYALLINIGEIHGGINLYNSGLAAGIVVSVYLPVIVAIKGEILKWKKKKRKLQK